MPKKGYKQTLEHRAKISVAKKGRVFSDEHRANLAASIRQAKSARKRSPLVRFVRLAGVTDDPPACWEWQGHRDKNGYAYFNCGGRTVRGARWVYGQLRAPLAHGQVVDHLCNNPPCVNPAHLVVATQRENILRGRGLAAENARKTHCKRGHEFTPENTKVYSGMRHCLTCKSTQRQRSKEETHARN